MKVLLLAFFVAAVSAVPLPDEDVGPVELIVNGVPDGEPLEISDIVDIKLKEHANGEVVATNLLHPYTAVGIAEAAAAAAEESIVAQPVAIPEPVIPEVIVPAPIALPQPVAPEVIVPEPVVLPQPVLPEIIPQPVALPEQVQPAVVSPVVADPEPVILPQPVAPEVIIPEPVIVAPGNPEVVIPEAVLQPVAQDNEVYNDGVVSVTVNAPDAEAGVFSTLQSWFSMVINYFSDGTQTTHQIV